MVPERNPVELAKGTDTEPRRRELGMISLGELHSGPQTEDGILVSGFRTHV